MEAQPSLTGKTVSYHEYELIYMLMWMLFNSKFVAIEQQDLIGSEMLHPNIEMPYQTLNWYISIGLIEKMAVHSPLVHWTQKWQYRHQKPKYRLTNLGIEYYRKWVKWFGELNQHARDL